MAVVLCAIGTPAERSRQAALNAPPPASRQLPVIAAAPAPASVSAVGVTPQSVSFNLPVTDETYPGSAEADVTNANCASCHFPGMVMTQPSLTRITWTGKVNKMRNAFKAPIAAGDVPPIVAYLADLRPAPQARFPASRERDVRPSIEASMSPRLFPPPHPPFAPPWSG